MEELLALLDAKRRGFRLSYYKGRWEASLHHMDNSYVVQCATTADEAVVRLWEQVKDWPALPEVTAVKRGITLDDLFDSIA